MAETLKVKRGDTTFVTSLDESSENRLFGCRFQRFTLPIGWEGLRASSSAGKLIA